MPCRKLNKHMDVGDIVRWTRTFTEQDIRLFVEVSGDEGLHHLVPDEKGRLMAHGLLTATLPIKVGGDMNLIAREMLFQFHRPVFAGDTIECEVTLTEREQVEDFINVASTFVCRNQAGKEVLTGHARGVIRSSPPTWRQRLMK